MKVLFDTNVLLDLLLARSPHVETAARLLSSVDTGRIEGVVSATTVTTIHYIAAKSVGQKQARKLLRDLLALLQVAPIDGDVLAKALALNFTDFEDAVLHEAARASGAAAIVTRNVKDFTRATIPVFSPRELLAVITASE